MFELLHLESARILETCGALAARIEARFPDTTLLKLAQSLYHCIEQSDAEREALARPIMLFRVGAAVVSALLITSVAYVTIFVTPEVRNWDWPSFLQMVESAINDIVFVAVAMFFLFSLEGRARRRQRINRVHELRALAHLIDMVQLTKDPERVLGSGPATEASPPQTLSAFELNRYLDYCSELLSLTSKTGVLYAQGVADAVVLAEVNELEDLCTGLSQKVWQKIMLLEQMRGVVR